MIIVLKYDHRLVHYESKGQPSRTVQLVFQISMRFNQSIVVFMANYLRVFNEGHQDEVVILDLLDLLDRVEHLVHVIIVELIVILLESVHNI